VSSVTFYNFPLLFSNFLLEFFRIFHDFPWVSLTFYEHITRLVASKAIICAFIDNPKPLRIHNRCEYIKEFRRPLDFSSTCLHPTGYDAVTKMWPSNFGSRRWCEPTTNVDLWRDDVYDKTNKVPVKCRNIFTRSELGSQVVRCFRCKNRCIKLE